MYLSYNWNQFTKNLINGGKAASIRSVLAHCGPVVYWWSLLLHELHSILFCGQPRSIKINCGQPRSIPVHCGPSWSTAVHCRRCGDHCGYRRRSQSIADHCGPQRSTAVHCGGIFEKNSCIVNFWRIHSMNFMPCIFSVTAPLHLIFLGGLPTV